ncbi:hypothetical protein BDA96_01G198900 [Sorghum bicolor]|uniref:Uncharacterized protein n=1 Tax=Sorghum bicolor TaxID=4558 RepID=A0A921UYR6_SORBI|nr:hypothetical protein BDA96_01G198900 [Sorghum bicolor]
MENTGPCGDFEKIMVDLESENQIANVAGMNHASTLIAEGKIPEPQLMCRLISGLASNLEKPGHEFSIKRKIYKTLVAIRKAINRNHMNMDSSARLRCLQDHASMVRMWTTQGQLVAVKMVCDVFRLSPANINNTRCVTTFASLMLSPYTTVVCACEDALLSLPPIPGFAFTIARAYCHILIAMPPQSSPQICSVFAMLGRLNQISMTTVEVNHPRFDDLAVDVLGCLANCKLVVQKKVLNLVVGLLTLKNVYDVLGILNSELVMAASANIHIEYQQMLEKAIRECHSAYPESIPQFTLDPKYAVFTDCIRYIKDIMNNNPLLQSQLLKGLLRMLRHVKSPLVCGAAIWTISKQILGSEMEDEYILPTEYCGVTVQGAQGERQQPWLMEMEELLFVRIGLARQVDGSYDIASSSKSSASSGYPHKVSLELSDNLAFLVHSGDALLADFVENRLSKLVVKAESYNEI